MKHLKDATTHGALETSPAALSWTHNGEVPFHHTNHLSPFWPLVASALAQTRRRAHTCVHAYVLAYTCIHTHNHTQTCTQGMDKLEHRSHTWHVHTHSHAHLHTDTCAWRHMHTPHGMCIHASSHMYVHRYMCTCICAYANGSQDIHVHMCTYVHVHPCTHAHVQTYMHACTCAHMHMHAPDNPSNSSQPVESTEPRAQIEVHILTVTSFLSEAQKHTSEKGQYF